MWLPNPTIALYPHYSRFTFWYPATACFLTVLYFSFLNSLPWIAFGVTAIAILDGVPL